MANPILVRKNVKGDGNCLFRAISLALSKQDNHKKLRQRAMDYIQNNLYTKRPENKATFASALLDSEINKEYKIDHPDADKRTQIAATLKQMRVDGEIAGSIAIEAICNIENCNIIRVNEELQPEYPEKFTPDYGNGSQTIRISYKNRHYQYFSHEINDDTLANAVDGQVNNDFIELAREVMVEDSRVPSELEFRATIKQHLLNKDIDSQNYDAVIDIFIDDWISAPINKKHETFKKIIFELDNQDKIFESFQKLIVNNLENNTNNPILASTTFFPKPKL